MSVNTAGLTVADCHCDTVWRLKETGYDFKRHNEQAHLDLPRLLKGRVAVQFFAVCSAARGRPGQYLSEALGYIGRYLDCLEENSDYLIPLREYADLERAEGERKIACLLALEGAEPLEDNPDLLSVFYRLGVRCISLTWNHRNRFADGVGEGESRGGLTRQGRWMVSEMARQKIILDLAHISEPGFFDALELAGKPPLVSHANARALCDHPRNLSDRQLKELARKGGVAALSFYPPFIAGSEQATLSQLADHFVHVAGVAGVEHLAIGSDFDGIELTVAGLPDASAHPALLEALAERGFSREELELIAGGNIRRLLRENLA